MDVEVRSLNSKKEKKHFKQVASLERKHADLLQKCADLEIEIRSLKKRRGASKEKEV
eukprot:CAMPEP_0170501852 /NCGR_PEP_ID=MMETSP0208-20121228/39639_1 /TAXON_ID=197538 /ORGANISM="Strombidium inclinatum, Strain S3" /LENGTH=56 /DNA_ID=CAMNT_0010780599 /DNA_START=60 /DNA_END=230 /DNA_ORIENTATION=+